MAQQYKVQQGETLTIIAQRFEIELADLLNANGQIADPDKIKEGDRINIPAKGDGQSVPSPSPGRIHIVQRGEDLSKIAPLYGLTLDELIAANGQIADPDRIKEGDRINIPSPSSGRIHIVQRGEDLSKIAPLYGLTLAELIAANIDVGDRINIPSPSSGRIHIVQRGEDLSKIAPLYGLTLDELIAANGQIADPDRIDVGDRINIPAKGGGQSVPSPSPGRIHIVQRGEDLSKIAPLYGLTLAELIAANIDVGDRINIPSPSPGRIHIVQRGEDLSKIAPLYGLTLAELIAANIDVGDRINIPSPSSGRIHIVQRGEDLSKIAPLYGLTLAELIAANGQIADPDNIDVGDRINIPSPSSGRIHIVQPGEDLFKIAPLYGLTLAELIAANIDVGDRINIPSPSSGRIHIVQRGEDLSKIAPLYGLTLDELIAANIDVGDRINIPSPSSGRIHIVQPGEDLFKIAPLYGLTLDELIAANGQIADPDRIKEGDRINIPAKGGRWTECT